MESPETQEAIRHALGTSCLRNAGIPGTGLICSGETFDTDRGRVYIKVNTKPNARVMFDGECASLTVIHATGLVRVPTPIKVIDMPGDGAMLAMEFVDTRQGLSKHAATLGEQLARLHLHNEEIGRRVAKRETTIHKDGADVQHVNQFGFHVNGCVGFYEMDNAWSSNWPTFFANRIETLMRLVGEQYGDREASQLWSQLLLRLPRFFKDIDVKPALLHGDLWLGNTAETDDGPVVFDPSSYYGHSEFDIVNSKCSNEDGLGSQFYESYHRIIPTTPGHRQRADLYRLFNRLAHWIHFGAKHRNSCVTALQTCLRHYN